MFPISVGTTGFGDLITGIGGIGKLNEAKEIVEKYKLIYAKELQEYESIVEDFFNNEMQQTGDLKLKINDAREEVADLLNQISFLDVNLKPLKIGNSIVDTKQYASQLNKEINVTKKVFTGILNSIPKAAGLSASAVFGAAGLGVAIGEASTGTAISTLSGAAFDNALMAWLGGGALEAGGLGIAGGIIVLSALAIIPALFMVGIGLSLKGEKVLTEANSFKYKIEKEISKMNAAQKDIENSRQWIKLYNAQLENLLNKINESIKTCKRKYYPKNKIIFIIKNLYIKTPNFIKKIASRIFKTKYEPYKDIEILIYLTKIATEMIKMPVFEPKSFKISKALKKILNE